MPGEVTTQEILRKAADVIRTNGWWQGDFFQAPDLEDDRSPNECKVCALGAIAVAAGCDIDSLGLMAPSTDEERAAIVAARAFANHLGMTTTLQDSWEVRADAIREIGAWNDAEDRTASQVIAALLVAAGGEA